MPGMSASAAPAPAAASASSSTNGTTPTPVAKPSPRTTAPASGSRMKSANTAAPTNTNGFFQPLVSAPPPPLSSRRAQGLDMRTVETKAPASKEKPKRGRPHDLLEAPTYRPTEEEFKDPVAYINSVSEEGAKYGIIKIIPPDSWAPNFAIDTERFHFKTRRQELNSVEGGTRSNLNYLDQLHKFHKQQGTHLNRFPSVDKRPLDLYRLKKAVDIRGGFNTVCMLKKWAEIGRDLGYSGKIMSSLSTSLKNSYQRYLHPYEEYLKTAKPGVQKQLEAEYGGPLTPSPVPSPAGKMPIKGRFDSPGPADSPAVRASHVLQESFMACLEEKDDSPMPDAPTSTPSSGFTPLNKGGFTPLNSGGFTPVNKSKPPTPLGDLSIKTQNGQSPKDHREKRSSTPERPSSSNGTGHTKRPLSEEVGKSPSKDENGEDNPESGERRSKRLRKDTAPTVAGSHMTMHRQSTPRLANDRPNKNNNPGEKCEHCGKGDDATKLLLCDSCDSGYHLYCLDPPVTAIPERDWYCNRCLVGTGEFGFEDGPVYSLRQFQEKANNFKDNYFAGKMPFDPVVNGRKAVLEDDVEREFWRLVESVHETVEVEYGADIHSTTHGSGFPTMEKEPLNKYSHDPWNLNILPLHQDSLFRHIKSDVSGMTVPWLYVGMCFSTFCWHNEDHYTYSANFQHFGATKTWYGIPASDAIKFEEAMKEAVPELFETQPDLLFQLVTLLPPSTLMKAGVKVYALDQRAGQFVITFPQAYHAGFNHGFNFNEAVNFAPADWEPFGREGVHRYQEFRKAPVFSHDELLITAASRDTSIKTALWLAPALDKIRKREMQERAELRELIPDLTEEVIEEDLSEDQYQCGVCKTFSYLSQMTCSCTCNVACASHFRDICDCSNDKLILRLRMSDEVLDDLVNKIHEKANMPKNWVAKLEKATGDTNRPALKTLRSLLAEGEKIPCFMKEIAPLKAFVERVNEWVEDATNYITRKSQNRRKNDKVWRKGSTKAAELEERDRELRKVENIIRLLDEADALAFDAPEIEQLRERADAIGDFQQKARQALEGARRGLDRDIAPDYLEELVEMGRSFNVDLGETEQLEKVLAQAKWLDTAKNAKRTKHQTLKEVEDMIDQGYELGIPEHNDLMDWHERQRNAGRLWEEKAKQLMTEDPVHYPQLESLATQALYIPVQKDTRAQMDQLLNKHREFQRQILQLLRRSQNPDFEQRPQYKEVKDILDGLSDQASKPGGALDLEKEQKRHEDWMRKGKKLFGKANAPLHILNAHMQYVENRNAACFATADRPRTPVEPNSREQSPSAPGESSNNSSLPGRMFSGGESSGNSDRSREIFCICRQPEAGMMIECEVCHEWYHGKCLKIARGKVKEDDKYTCPICDYRVKIPRDAARPKLEDLIQWELEIQDLPFQPEEQDSLRRIIGVAKQFRDYIRPYTQSAMGMTSAEIPIMRFYLRKIEGAETLLVHETNFFRAELHRSMPIAPEAPPVLTASTSTRKPRPTKQQKLMMSLGIENPEDLPPNMRPKSSTKKKSVEPIAIAQRSPTAIQPAPNHGSPMTAATASPPPHSGPITQPQFDYSPQFAMSSQVSPGFASASPGFSSDQPRLITSPVLNHGMMRGAGLDAMLTGPDAMPFNSTTSFGHGQATLPARSVTPPFAAATLNRDMSSFLTFDDEPSGILAPNDTNQFLSLDPGSVYEPESREADEAFRARLDEEAARAEDAVLQEFSTVGDDDGGNAPNGGEPEID